MSISQLPSGPTNEELVLDFDELEAELAAAATSGITARESHMLRVKTLYTLACSIAGVFLGIYLFHLGGFTGLVKYYIADMVGLTLGFAIAGSLMRKHSSIRILQAGVLMSAVVYLSLLALGTEAIAYVLVIGFLAGLGEGFYWTSNNLSEFVVTSGPTRNQYYGRSTFWGSLVAMIGPPLAGAIVYVFHGDAGSSVGYYVLFGFLVLTLISVAISAQGMVKSTGLRFGVRQVFRSGVTPRWALVLSQQFFRGMWGAALPALTPVLLLTFVSGEMTVGLLTAASAIVGAVFARIAARALHWKPNAALVGAVMVPVAMIGFATGTDWFAVFCISFLMKAVDPFAAIPATRANFDTLDAADVHWRDSFHRIVEVEIVLNAGRLVSFLAVLFVVGGGSDVDNVRNAILVAAVLPLIAGGIQMALDRMAANHADDKAALAAT